MTAAIMKDLTRAEMEVLLRRHHVGRIAFRDGRRVDIEPISYVYDDGAIYGRAAPGTRMTALSRWPWVAFEVDEIRGSFDWESVVIKGTVYVVEPVQAMPMREHYEKALQVIRSVMPDALTDRDPAPERTVLFRMQTDDMEGRSAKPGAAIVDRPDTPA